MKFTQIPSDTFSHLQLNAGLLLTDFTPATGTLDKADIVGATSGGVKFTAKPSYTDFGDDIDNCPENMAELKRLDSVEVTISGTFVTVSPSSAVSTIGAADIDPKDATHVVPRADLKTTDFKDLWWVGDYSDQNGDTNGGFVAIHMKKTLSTGGFALTSDDKKKGQFDFEYTAHYSMEDPTAIPYELYIKAGTAETSTTTSTGTGA
ncbi:MAG: hypothetical protein ACI38Z_05100 [Parafannyhessea sp.]|uniref:hypothetical protein n=1 Tax=Parafannyhessea sp. TaxID=2847324 RepID=UPI003F0D886B